jgi:L-gulono-1,4-lactone dehydrogenase
VSRVWRNWSGHVSCRPAFQARPADELAVAAFVRSVVERGLSVRVAGAGHSFSPLACTDGVLIDLRDLRGVVAVDERAMTCTVRAGTRVEEAAAALEGRGLALSGHGTARRSTVAGVVATGTHGGSGVHPSLGAHLVEARVVAGDGSVRDCSEASDPEALACLRTSLGALGVVTRLVLRCVPARNLAAVERAEPFDAAVERIPEWAEAGEYASLLWLPWRDSVVTRCLDPTPDPVTPASLWGRVRDGWLRGRVGRAAVSRLGAARPGWVPRLAEPLLPGPAARTVATTFAAQVFDQPVRLTAMEYAVPLEALGAALRALRPVLRRAGYTPVLPIEVRPGPAETSPLSPAHGRPTGWISLIAPLGPQGRRWLEAAEPVLLDHAGRPHWGKEHGCTANELAGRYPRWDAFQAVRARLDPAGVFRNPYLDRVLGPS